MDGYELARRLRQLPAWSAVRMLAVTGYGQDTDRARSRNAGFDQHLVKPIRIEQLERAVGDED
jgi:CheY-like chemotaxis protein